MNTGYIKLSRKLRDWQWYGTPNMVAVWVELLLRARFEDGYYNGKLIKKGCAVFGREELAKKIGLQPQQIRTCINRLKSTNEITTESTNRFTIATIVKWEEYQCILKDDNQENNQQYNHQLTSKQPASNQQVTTSNNVKNVNNDKNIYLDKLISDAVEAFNNEVDDIDDENWW